jgi:predicted Fe-Mo cluster-binding NifX family protein
MMVALTLSGERVAPRFETAGKLLLARGGRRRVVPFSGRTPVDRVDEVRETEAEALICGGIERFPWDLLLASGIGVYPWVVGEAEGVLARFLERGRGSALVAVTATEPDPTARVAARRGQASWILLYDPARGSYDVLTGIAPDGGGGMRVARAVLRAGATALITGSAVTCPNARGTLAAAGVAIATVPDGTVREAVDAWRKGNLRPEPGARIRVGRPRRRPAPGGKDSRE